MTPGSLLVSALDRPLRPAVAPVGSRWGMTSARLWVAHGVILFLLAASAYDILRGREHWPFSCYPMYSRVELDPLMTQFRIFGVPAEGPARELILQDRRYIEPFDNSRLGQALKRIDAGDNPETRLRVALTDCLRRYEALRLAGYHDGPPLQALRLYRLTWVLDPRAANRERPETRHLIAEVEPPSAGAARHP